MLTRLLRRNHVRCDAEFRCGKRPRGMDVRFWRPGDTAAILAMYNDPAVRPGAGKGAARSEAQWEWEFRRGGAIAQPAYVIAMVGDRLIGTQAYIPIEMYCDGGIIMTGKDEDTLVHPEFRGCGVLDAMYELLLERARSDGLAALWGFTSTAVKALERNGFVQIGGFDAMWRGLEAGGSAPTGHRDTDPTGWKDGDCTDRTVEIRRIDELDERFDVFAAEFAAGHGGIGLRLSAEYLSWRVMHNPYVRCEVFGAFDGNRVVGIVVLKRDDERQKAYLSDLAVLSDAEHSESHLADRLIRCAMEAAIREGFHALESRFSGAHPYNKMIRDVLARHGFVGAGPTDRATPFLIRGVGMRTAEFTDMARWRLCELMREY